MKYPYRCRNEECKYEVVISHPMKDEQIKICPKCEQETFGVVLGSSPFLLKGDGWAKHDKSGVVHPKGGT